MSITSRIAELAHNRYLAEQVLSAAQTAVDRLRVQHLQAELGAAFPTGITAVFIRPWDTDTPRLETILGPDTELNVFDDDYEDLSADQKRVVALSDKTVRLLGEDENIWSYMGSAESEGSDWSEFRLDLRSHAHRA